MPDYALSDIVAAADAKYGDLRIPDVVTLRNSLRLPKATRRTLEKMQESIDALQRDENDLELPEARRQEIASIKARVLRKVGTTGYDGDEDETEQEGLLRLVDEVLELVADSPEGAERFRAAVGDNLPVLLETFERYGEVSQPGEAQPSAT